MLDFLYSHIYYSQIWANPLIDDSHFKHITKLKKKIHWWQCEKQREISFRLLNNIV